MMEEYEEYQELDCSICIQRYNDHKIPRNLICGHSVCTSCLEQLMWNERRCPECRTDFTISKPSDLPINYPLLRMSRIITYAKTDPNVYPELSFPLKSPSSKLRQNAGKCSAHESTLFFMCITCNVWVCRVCVDIQHPDPPHGKCFIVSVEDAIEKMKSLHKNNLDTYADEMLLVKKKIEAEIGNLVVAVKCLKFQNNSCDFGFNTDILSFENHINIFQNVVSALDEMSDILLKSSHEVQNSNTPQEMDESIKLSNKSQLASENLLEKEKRRELPDLSLEILLRGKGLKDLLKEGNPVYVEKHTNSSSWAKIAVKNDRFHLYSLVDGFPPEDGICLPYDSVRALVPKESPVLFMEIGWESEFRGVVYIRMYGDTLRARNAVFLCSGEQSRSYKDAAFIAVKKEHNAIQLEGGDFENNRGMRALSVIDEKITFSPDYIHDMKAGLFFGYHENCTYQLGLFSVCLTDGQPGQKNHSGFGFVEEGLDILSKVSLLADVRNASVMDCGLIIPL